MKEHVKDLLQGVPPYTRFLSVREIDNLVSKLKDLPGVNFTRIGETLEGEPLNMLQVGEGERTALVIGVPHSDEPLGSLVTTYLARWLATGPRSKDLGWRWLLIPILERTGMRLNEGWFYRPGSFADNAKSYFRRPTEDQYEWSFPIEYDDYKWQRSRPETRAIQKILKKEKPDLLCSLHHSGFSNAYYYFSSDMPHLYPPLVKLARGLRLPLSTSSPDVPFGKSLHPGFFQMYGLSDYIDYYRKSAPEILAVLKRGACSDEWYGKEIGGFSFNCEVPMYLSPPLRNKNITKKSFKKINLERYRKERKGIEYSKKIMSKLEVFKDLSDPMLYDFALKHIANAELALRHKERNQELLDDRPATVAEVFEHGALADTFNLFFLGQIWRVAESICLSGSAQKICRLMEFTDLDIRSQAKVIEGTGNFYHIPLNIPVKMQLGSIMIISDFLANGS